MTNKPTPEDFFKTANVLQDVASRDKIELPPCTSFCQNSDNSNGLCRACFEREKTSHGILLNIAKRMTVDSCVDYPQWLFTLIKEAIKSDKPEPNPPADVQAALDAVNKFIRAKEKAEEFLPSKTGQNLSAWLSCFMSHVNYRLSYADWERLELAQDALTARQEPVDAELGTAVQAIQFAITIDDHFASVGNMVAPDGYKLVPIEPTEEMFDAGFEQYKRDELNYDKVYVGDIYEAMLSAAPTHAPTEKKDPREIGLDPVKIHRQRERDKAALETILKTAQKQLTHEQTEIDLDKLATEIMDKYLVGNCEYLQFGDGVVLALREIAANYYFVMRHEDKK